MIGKRRRGTRAAHTLLELVAASALVSIAIVSTMTIMGQSLDISSDAENRKLATTLCVSKVEEHLAALTLGFTEGTFSGTFAADGYPQLRFGVVRTAAVASGGIPDELMVVEVTVWMDNDSNGALGVGEPSAAMRTKVARLTAWEI